MLQSKLLQTANHLLRVPRFASRTFPDISPLRQIFLANARWTRDKDGQDVLTLGPGGRVYLQLRDCHLSCWENPESVSISVKLEKVAQQAARLLALAHAGVIAPRAGNVELGWTGYGGFSEQWKFPLESNVLNGSDVLLRAGEARSGMLASLLCSHLGGWTNRQRGAADIEVTIGELSREGFCPDLDEALTGFQLGLDQAALQACRDLGMPSHLLYNYLAACPEELALCRCQAVRAFPMLAGYLAESTEVPAVLIRVAIDCRMSLIGSIASAFEVTRDVVKRVAGRTLDELGFDVRLAYYEGGHPHWPGQCPEPMEIGEFFALLGQVAPEQLPASREDWRELHVLHDLLDWTCMRDDDLCARVLQYFAVRGWSRASTELAAKYGSMGIVRECGDFLDGLSELLCDEAVGPRMGSRKLASRARGVANRFATQQGMRRLFDLVARWRSRYEAAWSRHVAAHPESGPVLAFPLGEPVGLNGQVVVPLLSYADLAAEGAAMMHCVVTCYVRMQSGSASFFSVRTPAGVRLSTFDLSFSADEDKFLCVTLNQHRGASNSITPAVCDQTVTDFVALLEGRHASELLAYVQSREAHRAISGPLAEDEPAVVDPEVELKRGALIEVVKGDIPKLVHALRAKRRGTAAL